MSLTALFKAKGLDDEQEFRLTHFDVQEVSTVDHPANTVEWLVVKGVQNMGVAALKEILGNGLGEFVGKEAPAGGEGSTAGSGAAGQSSGGLKLSNAKKTEVIQSLGSVIQALAEVGKAIDGAEVDEAASALPDQLTTVIRNAANVLAKMVGGTAAQAGTAATESAADTADKTNKAKVDTFAQNIALIEGLVGNLVTALGGTATESSNAGAGASTGSQGAGDVLDVGKALATLTDVIKAQGAEITTLKSSLNLPAAGSGDRGNTSKAREEHSSFAWPIMDMNADRDRRRR